MTISLPRDVIALLRKGYQTSVEQNSREFSKALLQPYDYDIAVAEWGEGYHGPPLKSLTPFQLSVRLLSVIEELDASEGTFVLSGAHVMRLCAMLMKT